MPEKSRRTWRAPWRATSCSASSSDCDQWWSRRPKRRRCATSSVRSLTISTRFSDDALCRSNEGGWKDDVQGTRSVEIHDEVGLCEVQERNVLRIFAAHDLRRGGRGNQA